MKFYVDLPVLAESRSVFPCLRQRIGRIKGFTCDIKCKAVVQGAKRLALLLSASLDLVPLTEKFAFLMAFHFLFIGKEVTAVITTLADCRDLYWAHKPNPEPAQP